MSVPYQPVGTVSIEIGGAPESAKALGLTLPPGLVVAADEAID
jgi:hypothetical protein